jgi:hypothetical protein
MITLGAVTATPSTGRAIHSHYEFFERPKRRTSAGFRDAPSRRNKATTSAPSISTIPEAICVGRHLAGVCLKVCGGGLRMGVICN